MPPSERIPRTSACHSRTTPPRNRRRIRRKRRQWQFRLSLERCSSQCCPQAINLAPLLFLAPLSVHIDLRLLHHAQPLHPQDVRLEKRLLGLQPRLQVEHVLGVRGRREALAQLLNAIHALRRTFIDRLRKALGRGIRLVQLRKLLRLEVVSRRRVRLIARCVVAREIAERASAGALEQALDLAELLRKRVADLRVVQQRCQGSEHLHIRLSLWNTGNHTSGSSPTIARTRSSTSTAAVRP